MNLMRLGAHSNKSMNLKDYRYSWFVMFLRGSAALLALVVLLASCGARRVQTETSSAFALDARGSSYLALQDGEDDWQVLSDAQGLSTVSLSDPQGRYSVMSVCRDESSGAISVQFKQGVVPSLVAGTAAAVTPPLVRLSCGPAEAAGNSAEVRGTVQGLGEGEYGSLYLGGASALIDASAPVTSLEVQHVSNPDLDLVATKYAPDALLPSMLILEPGLAFSPNLVTSIDLDFTSPGAVTLEAAEVPLTGRLPNEFLSGSVELLTRSGTHALLGESVSIGALGYARPPESLLRGAALRAEAQSFSYNDRTKAGSSRSVSRTFREGAVAPLELPLPLELRAPVLMGSADNLRPRSSWTVQPVAGGDYTQFYSQVREGHSVSYRFSQSMTSLSSRFPGAATFAQTLPDFSKLPGWRAEWNLTRGADVFWDVSFRTEDDSGTTSSSRSGVLDTAPNP